MQTRRGKNNKTKPADAQTSGVDYYFFLLQGKDPHHMKFLQGLIGFFYYVIWFCHFRSVDQIILSFFLVSVTYQLCHGMIFEEEGE